MIGAARQRRVREQPAHSWLSSRFIWDRMDLPPPPPLAVYPHPHPPRPHSPPRRIVGACASARMGVGEGAGRQHVPRRTSERMGGQVGSVRHSARQRGWGEGGR